MEFDDLSVLDQSHKSKISKKEVEYLLSKFLVTDVEGVCILQNVFFSFLAYTEHSGTIPGRSRCRWTLRCGGRSSRCWNPWCTPRHLSLCCWWYVPWGRYARRYAVPRLVYSIHERCHHLQSVAISSSSLLNWIFTSRSKTKGFFFFFF